MFGLYLKRHLKTTIIWCVVLLVFLIASMTKYDAFALNPMQATGLLDKLPNAIKVIYGMSDVDVATLGGYYVVVVFYFQLMLAIFSATLGAKIIYEEEDLKTSEFLFVKPISRTKVLLIKLLGAFSVVTFLNIFISLTSYIYITSKYGDVDNFLEINLVQYVVCLFSLIVGTLLTSIKSNRFASIASASIIMGFFIIRSIALLVEINLQFLTPFLAFETSSVFQEGINYIYILYYLALSVLLLILAIINLNRRDIRN